MKKMIVGLVAAAAVTAPIALTAAPAQAAVPTMTQARAGSYYLNQVCYANRAVNHLFDVAPTRANGYIYASDLTGRALVRTKAAARRTSKVSHFVARQLFNPPAAWPSNVSRLVDRMGLIFERESNIYDRMGHASNGRQLIRFWNRIPVNTPSGVIRARLNLPPAGRGC